MKRIRMDFSDRKHLHYRNPRRDDLLATICSKVCREYGTTLAFKKSLDQRKYLKAAKAILVSHLKDEEELQKKIFQKFTKRLTKLRDLCESEEAFDRGANLLVRQLDHAVSTQTNKASPVMQEFPVLRLEKPFQKQIWHAQFSEFDRMMLVSNIVDLTKTPKMGRDLAWKSIRCAENAAFSLARDRNDYKLRLKRSISRIHEEML
ncbi:unnamed protein product, partial [Mesorhabditis belari]|uniref:Uncharacterized protein n=1 Tax=Mesorhabditis belari TaxID=2138241 RepID=A0AAF3FHA7_9BILA